jgi:hypothetical protein
VNGNAHGLEGVAVGNAVSKCIFGDLRQLGLEAIQFRIG